MRGQLLLGADGPGKAEIDERLHPGDVERAGVGRASHGRGVGSKPKVVIAPARTGTSTMPIVSPAATRVDVTQSWADLVLAEDTLDQVNGLVARLRHGHQVLDGWGYREKLARGAE